jgi:arylsulfatase A-like enzyme
MIRNLGYIYTRQSITMGKMEKPSIQKEMRLTAYQLFLFFCAVAALGCSGPEETSESRPNIIYIMADDLGYGDLGSYGQQWIQTPNIDRLAAEGMRFTQCYTGSTVCAPSRSVLMTGLHTGHTTVRGNFGKTGVVGLGGGQGRVPLRDEDVTVAEVLKQTGYVTGMTGKWGLGEPNTTGHPNRQGFDEFFGFLNQRRAHHYFVDYLWHNEEKVILEGNLDGKREQYAHDLFTEFALDFIRDHQDTTFFLYIPYTVPHAEYEIPDTTPYTDRNWEWKEKVHAAMITRMDRDIGRIMQSLRDFGIDERTIVFFCSDNGAAERWEGRFDSSGPLRGRKRDMYEGGIRTPMIVRYPGKTPAGQTSDMPWYFADVLPTLADLVGTPAPDNLDGISVKPALFGEEQSMTDRYFYWEFHERGYQQAVRWNDWKAIRPAPDQPLQLYNLAADPGESDNVADKYPEMIQQMEDYLKTARTPSIDWPGV